MLTRLCVIGRWGARPDKDWYPWLRKELETSQTPPFSEIDIPHLPDPDAPTIDGWSGALPSFLPPAARPDTLLVGHSVGCQAILHFLAQTSDLPPLGAVLLVAGWWTVDRPWDSIRPWLDASHDFPAIRKAAPSIHVLLSDNDPFTADHLTTQSLFQERLGAKVSLVSGAKHFNAPQEPAVLDAILSLAKS